MKTLYALAALLAAYLLSGHRFDKALEAGPTRYNPANDPECFT